MKDDKEKPQYIPDIPQDFKKTLGDEDIIKPKNRFKYWKPVVRNLDSTYEVKDVKVGPTPHLTESHDLVNPNRRAGKGGKKLFMTKENGIERANNYQSGY